MRQFRPMRVMRGTLLFVAALVFSAVPVWADTPKPFPDFSAKSVRPPAASSTAKRINVQIEPYAPASDGAIGALEDQSQQQPVAERYGAFWDAVSPRLAMASAGRIEAALSQVAGTVPAPRLQDLQTIASQYGIDILTATIGTQVSPALALAVIAVESSGQAQAVSSAGAAGLMQLMPDTAQRFDVRDPMDPAGNIAGGVAYLDWLMSRYDMDPILALAGYNAGEGAVQEHEGVPPYAETRDYVPKVIAAFQIARGLCITPPELASDGCVFSVMN